MDLSDKSAGEVYFQFVRLFPRGGLLLVATVLTLLFPAPRSAAQTYSIDWYKVAGGGGTSTNGAFALSGTIGQADAGGPLTGGNYAVSGGFWTVASVTTPGAPSLRIFLTSTNTALVSWPSPSTGFSLQVRTNSLNSSTWLPASETVHDDGAQKWIIVSPPSGNRFYRLSNP